MNRYRCSLSPIALSALIGIAFSLPSSAGPVKHLPRKAVSQATRNLTLPLYFESVATSGSSDRFVAHGLGYRLGLSPTKAHFALHNTPLTLALKGANPNATLTPQQTLPTRVNYLLGNNPNAWKTNLPTFGKVRAQGVYPGIDLVYYGNGKQLEYDFIVAPKSDPSRIRLKFAEAKQVAVEKDGSLRLGLGKGSVRWKAPVAYQEQSGKRMAVASRYVVDGAGAVSFSLGRYDHSKPLIIDPVFLYSSFLGSSGGWDQAEAIAVDSSGCAYVCGTTGFYAGNTPDFPVSTGQTTFGGDTDAFVAKFSADGSYLIYATYLGGNGKDYGFGLAIDAGGNAFVTGDTTSTNFPTTPGVYQRGLQGSRDGFVARLSANGTNLVYGTYLGTANSTSAYGIVVNGEGEAYAVGETTDTGFSTGAAVQKIYGGGDADGFLIKFNGSGALRFATYIGGKGTDFALAVALDTAGNPYVTGATDSKESLPAFAFQSNNGGFQDAFVTKISTDGTTALMGTYLGGEDDDRGNAIAVDSSNRIYVTGSTYSTKFPVTPYAVQKQINVTPDNFVTQDIFVTCLNPDGTSLYYSTYFGGQGDESAYGIAIGPDNCAYLTGYTSSAELPAFPGSLQPIQGGEWDAFLLRLSNDGSRVTYGTFLGGFQDEIGTSIALAPNGEVYLAGYTASSDFPSTAKAFQSSQPGNGDGFVTRIKLDTRFDLNGDGTPDLLFQNSSNGEILAWLLDGARTVDRQYIRTSLSGTNYEVVGRGDFDGDGHGDILAQQKGTSQFIVIYLNGKAQKGRRYFGLPIDPLWRCVGTPDVNGDGYPDLLFRNQTNGHLQIWTLQNVTVTGKYTLYNERPGTPLFLPLDYQVVGAGDFNGDGTPDLLFQHQTAGIVLCWYLRWNSVTNAPEVLQRNYAIGRRDPKWKVVGAADVNRDGFNDLVLQNTDTGAVAALLMQRLSLVGTLYLRSSWPLDWKVIGLR